MSVPKGWPAMSIARANALLTAPGAPFEMAEAMIRGIPPRVWKNIPATLRDAFLIGCSHGARTFIVNEDERVTFDAFGRAVLALAERLSADGVVKGDRVALIMRNLPEWPVAFYAAAILGAIVTPLNAWWTGAELEYGLTDSGAKAVIVDAERYGRLEEHLPNCPALTRAYVARCTEDVMPPHVCCLDDVIGAPGSWASLPDRPLPDVGLHPDDDATIFYTSGTTGKPKGAIGTHRNMLSNIGAAGYSMARTYLRRGETPPAPDPAVQKVSLLTVPFFHATGCFAVMSPSLFSGARLVLMRRFEPEAAMALIEREGVTSAGGVPTIAWQLLEHPARAKYDLSSLEAVAYGGAPSAPELVRRIKEEWPKSMPGNGWGMTETSATFTTHIGEDYENRPDSAGPAVPVCDLRVVGADGDPLPPGAIGEVWGRGPNVVRGYWNKPEATAQSFTDGWVHTGDLGRVDEEGFLFIIDRAKDMLIRGGENIYCIEVENVLYDHPAVMDAALVGIPHKTLGEEPGAVVALKPGSEASEGELRAHVAAHLAAFKVPVRVVIQRDTLPRNANGKIMKNELKALFV